MPYPQPPRERTPSRLDKLAELQHLDLSQQRSDMENSANLMDQLKTLYGISQQAQLTPWHIQRLQDAHSMLPYEQAYKGAETSHISTADRLATAAGEREAQQFPEVLHGMQNANRKSDFDYQWAQPKAEQDYATRDLENQGRQVVMDEALGKHVSPQMLAMLQQLGVPKEALVAMANSVMPAEGKAAMADLAAKKSAAQAAALAQQTGTPPVAPSRDLGSSIGGAVRGVTVDLPEHLQNLEGSMTDMGQSFWANLLGIDPTQQPPQRSISQYQHDAQQPTPPGFLEYIRHLMGGVTPQPTQ